VKTPDLTGQELLHPIQVCVKIIRMCNVPKGPINELSDGGGTVNPTPGEDKHFVQANPKLAVRYQLAEPVGIRAAFYWAFRAPTLGEGFGNFTSVGFGLRPNPEVMYGGEAGLDMEVGRVSGQINYFWNEVNDQIIGVPVSFFPIFALQNQNLGKVRSRGVEVIGQVKATDTLSLLLGYTYTDSRIVRSFLPAFEGNRNPMVPKNFATFTLQYRDPRDLMLAVRGRYLGHQFSFPGNDDTDKIRDHFILDVSASYQFNHYVTVFLIGENVTDLTYVASRRDGPQLAPPFQMFGGLRVTIF
jgi:outer membrane receptor protein involved in Fe transport